MKTKKIPIILTFLFFAAMVFLSLSARAIHYRMIPNVTVSRLTKETFDSEHFLSDGITTMTRTEQLLAIPKELYDSGEIYVLTSAEKNGDTRTFVKAIDLEIGKENEGYYEVTNRFFDQKLRFVIKSSEDIEDGDEVYVTE